VPPDYWPLRCSDAKAYHAQHDRGTGHCAEDREDGYAERQRKG
jgi:hypothetical protein